MPIYEYTCRKCNNTFSLLQKVGSSEKDTTCPQCGSTEVKKKFSLCSHSSSKGSSELAPSVPNFGGGS